MAFIKRSIANLELLGDKPEWVEEDEDKKKASKEQVTTKKRDEEDK